MNYIQAIEQLKDFEQKATILDYNFALQLAFGIEPAEAYVQSILAKENTDKSPATIKSSCTINEKRAKTYAKKEHIVRLKDMFKEKLELSIERAVLANGATKGKANADLLSKTEIAQFITKVIRNAIKENLLTKEDSDLLKLYLTKIDDQEEDPQKYLDKFVHKVFPKLNGICGNPNCGKEIYVWGGFAVICNFCHAINDLTQEGKTIVYIPQEEYEHKTTEIIERLKATSTNRE